MATKLLITYLVPILCSLTLANATNQAVTRNPQIAGGFQAAFGQFPHAVAMILHLTSNEQSFCAANIIAANYLLTAAHCLEDIRRIHVLAGVRRIFGQNEYREMVEPRDTRKHPQYDRNTLRHDIGLIFLLRRVPLGDGSNGLQRIALPPRSHENNRFVGTTATITGWGRTSDDPFSTSEVLRFVSLPILSDQTCINLFNQHIQYFQPTNICLSGNRGSTCRGDSGGGLITNINGQPAVIGIVSYGTDSCENGNPTVMTRVTSYVDWISSNTGVRLQ